MATTTMRWAAVGTVGLAMFVLGSGCGGLSVEEYVSRVFDIQCERIYACCTSTEQEALSLGDGESGCRESLRSSEQAVNDSINDAVYFQLVDFDGGEAQTCLDALASSSCGDYFGNLGHDCGKAFKLRPQPGRVFSGTSSVGLDHFIRQCPLTDCISHTIAPACNGSNVGQ
jgi:hypothetical protein